MKIRYALASLVAAHVAATPVLAAEGFQISPRAGRSELRLSADALTSGQAVEKATTLAGVELGYVSPIGLMGEVGYSTQGNWDWFGATDKFRLSEYTLAVGFQIDTPSGFRITPKVGRARWDLYSREGLLTGTDPALDNTRRDYNNYWELSLQKEIRDDIALGVVFKDNPYEFGNVRSIAFTASFNL